MNSNIRKLVNGVKTLSLMALMFALVSAAVAAHSASASSATSPLADNRGVLSLTVAYNPVTSNSYADVVIYNEYGKAVEKLTARANQTVDVKLTEGVYKARISAPGYVTTTQVVEIVTNEVTYTKVALIKSNSPRTSR